MSLAYIRRVYGVPAKRGAIVTYLASDGEIIPAKITGSRGARIRAKLQRYDGTYNTKSSIFHPTWNLVYESQP